MKKFLLATAAILVTGSAYAADAVYEEAPVAVEAAGFTWSGFYVGIHGGYGWADADFTLNVQQSTITSESDLDGFLIGVHAGAQDQFDSNIVMGVEIDVDYRDGDGNGVAFGNGVPSPTSV
jgi:outer membrane immunogenic protein